MQSRNLILYSGFVLFAAIVFKLSPLLQTLPLLKVGFDLNHGNAGKHAIETRIDLNTHGFSSHTVRYSAAGKAVCLEGFLDVPVDATNSKILWDGPNDNFELTAFMTEFMRIGTDTIAKLDGGPVPISDTFAIFSTLCVPRNKTAANRITTVQFLTHGGTLDHSYWDFAENYSYVDTAAERGYATFSYDRLGTGRSQHPDPIQIVQAPLQVELGHVLVTWLKKGKIAGLSFPTVIGVGHSLGSGITQGIAAAYTDDFSALILTGHSAFMPGVPIGMASNGQQIANTLPYKRFSSLSNGYASPADVLQAILFGFYYYPHFDREIFERSFHSRQTNAIGETLTNIRAYAPVPDYRNPVYIINGQQDFFFCQGDCVASEDVTAAALPIYFPSASNKSRTENVPNIAHNINFHFGATKTFGKMLGFLEECGISP